MMMSQMQRQTSKPINEDEITKVIQKTIEAHGYPFFFQYSHGLTISIQTNDFKVDEDGCLNFYYENSICFFLLKSYISLELVEKPDINIKDSKVCLLIRQKRTREVLGWLCWE